MAVTTQSMNEMTPAQKLLAEQTNYEGKRDDETKKKDIEAAEKVKELLENFRRRDKKTLIDSITLGSLLLKTRQRLGTNFYYVITGNIIKARQVQRLIGLILDKNSAARFSTEKNPSEDFYVSLKADQRVIALTDVSQIANLKNPSQDKIKTMKFLSDTSFQKSLDGDDTEYNKIIATAKTANEAETLAKHLKQLPKGMAENEFKELLKDGVLKTIQKLQDTRDENERLKLDIRRLELEVRSREVEIAESAVVASQMSEGSKQPEVVQ